MKKILFIVALVMSTLSAMGQKRMHIIIDDNNAIEGYLIAKTDSSYCILATTRFVVRKAATVVNETNNSDTLQDVVGNMSHEACNDTISMLRKDIKEAYVFDDSYDGGVKPEQWREYRKVRNKVYKRAKVMASKELGKYFGKMGTCHYIWHYEKTIFKEEYNIDWKSPAELNPHILFD